MIQATSAERRPAAAAEDPARLAGRLRLVLADSLLRNSALLMLNTVAATGLGALFWMLAAHRFRPQEIGVLSATVAAATLVSTIGGFGLPNAVVRFLPRSPGRSAEILSTAGVVVSLGALSAAGVAAFVPGGLPLAHAGSPLTAVTLALATVLLTASGTILDAGFVAQRVAQLLLIKTLVSGVARIGMLVLIGGGTVIDLAQANLVGLGLATLVGIPLIARRLTGPAILHRRALRGVWSFSIGNHLGLLFGIMPLTVTPLIVLSRSGKSAAALFGIVIMLTSALNIVPSSLSQSLFAELSAATSVTRGPVLKALGAVYLLLMPAGIALFLLAPVLLGIFGSAYADGATHCLRWMVLGSMFAGCSYIIDVVVNSLGRARAFSFVNASNAVIVLTCCFVAAPDGITAVGLGWALAQATSLLISVAVLLSILAEPRTRTA